MKERRIYQGSVYEPDLWLETIVRAVKISGDGPPTIGFHLRTWQRLKKVKQP